MSSRPNMPLCNRVDPLGHLFATSERGVLMGNRGGRFHDPDAKTVTGQPWVSRQWICCVISFRGRQRNVWGQSYTELFFSDEYAALAAGHRPCFECRRSDALAFAKAWGEAVKSLPPKAADMDHLLDQERLEADPERPGKRRKRLHRFKCESLPDGAMILHENSPYLLRGNHFFRWQFNGYGPRKPRISGEVSVITPPAILACLSHGYKPLQLAGTEP